MSGTTSPSAPSAPVASNIAGTVTMFADQVATLNLDVGIPVGVEPGTLPPPVLTVDNPAVVSVSGAPTSNPAIDLVTVTGLGTPGTTTVHAGLNGVDETDFVFVLVARPLPTFAFDPNSVVVSNAPVPAAPAAA